MGRRSRRKWGQVRSPAVSAVTETAGRSEDEPSGGDAFEGRSWAAKAAATLVLLAAVAAAYARAFGAAFQFDDLLTVHRNARLVDLGRFVRQHLLADWASGGRAVTELTFALDHSIAGWSSVQFHASSILLHLATIAVLLVLTVRVLRRADVAGPYPWALAIAAIWGYTRSRPRP